MANLPNETVRDATYEERATWGECPVCQAPHGQPCNPDVGLALGMNVNGSPPREGVHIGRLNRAPFQVKLVPA